MQLSYWWFGSYESVLNGVSVLNSTHRWQHVQLRRNHSSKESKFWWHADESTSGRRAKLVTELVNLDLTGSVSSGLILVYHTSFGDSPEDIPSSLNKPLLNGRWPALPRKGLSSYSVYKLSTKDCLDVYVSIIRKSNVNQRWPFKLAAQQFLCFSHRVCQVKMILRCWWKEVTSKSQDQCQTLQQQLQL